MLYFKRDLSECRRRRQQITHPRKSGASRSTFIPCTCLCLQTEIAHVRRSFLCLIQKRLVDSKKES
ncbi:hypothetical protein TorRG33x02_277600 [Trema orientale]|uniref:Uncharacterized protein n=1 Tax=Trema orientale TaxID=63057 RepID=A0A2P5CPF8_TREOI|nr:hypothetical protein TorRG33x02_277600 [Trema orientale]